LHCVKTQKSIILLRMATTATHGSSTIAVLLDTDFAYGARVLDGVQAFARRSARWRVLPLHSTQEGLLGSLIAERKIDGVIGSFVSDRWVRDMADGVVPFVNVGNSSEIRSVPSVVADDHAVGRLAGRHLRERGWRTLCALHDPASHASRQRLDGFRAAAGGDVSTPPRGAGYATDATWDDWILALPRPFAVFCTTDFLARRLVQHLQACGCRVPADAAVVGVGDSVLDSVLAGVSLSSVTLPAERIGEHAALRLHGLLHGAADDGSAERVPPETVAVRESSSRTVGLSPLVSRALAHMDENLAGPLDVDGLAVSCGASRRLIELKFRAELGQGPAAVLRARRHALACRLLTETDIPLVEVALATGFAEPARFWTVFKARERCTPNAFRRRGAAPAVPSFDPARNRSVTGVERWTAAGEAKPLGVLFIRFRWTG
jgi:LacI family transcriptional regulator